MPSFLGIPFGLAIFEEAHCFPLCLNKYGLIEHHLVTEPSFDDVQSQILKEEDAPVLEDGRL